MQIKVITHQHRNDFSATLECEHCGGEQHLGSGYSDAYYYKHVIPSITCKACSKDSSGETKGQDNTTGSKPV